MSNLTSDQHSKLENCFTENEASICLELLESFKLPKDGEYYYFKGNLLAKQGNYAQSRIHLEKAKFEGFENSLLENNLNFVKSQLRTKYIEESKDFVGQVYYLANNNSYSFWSLFLWPFIIWQIVVLFKKSNKILKFIPLTFIIILSALVIYTKEDGHVSFSSKDISIFDGPSRAFDQVREVPAGIKFVTKELRKDWHYIIHPENLNGWVPKEDLVILE